MNWLVSLLRPLWSFLLSFGFKWVFNKGVEIVLAIKAKRERDAKIDKAAEELRSDIGKAGDDEQAQKDAIDKYLDSRK